MGQDAAAGEGKGAQPSRVCREKLLTRRVLFARLRPNGPFLLPPGSQMSFKKEGALASRLTHGGILVQAGSKRASYLPQHAFLGVPPMGTS